MFVKNVAMPIDTFTMNMFRKHAIYMYIYEYELFRSGRCSVVIDNIAWLRNRKKYN